MLTVTTPSTVYPVSLAEARLFLLQDDDITDQDFVITQLIGAATAQIEAATGRSLVNATFTQTFDTFADMGRLWRSSVSTVNSVKYYDDTNTQQTLSSSVYELVKEDPAFIRLKPSQEWPSVYNRGDAIAVEYVAGYGSTADAVPQGLKLCVLVLMAWLFENRQGQDYPRDTLRALCSSYTVPHAI